MRLYIWRHPKPIGIAGHCVGQADVPVQTRKLNRLANQIHSYVKKNKLPKTIWVSHLQRSKQVGELLAKRGFTCHVAPALAEIDFGVWNEKRWNNIAKADIDDWCNNFAHFAPQEGESLTQLFVRVATWLDERQADFALCDKDIATKQPVLVVGHAGWITAASFINAGQGVPNNAKDWSPPIPYGELKILEFKSSLDKR